MVKHEGQVTRSVQVGTWRRVRAMKGLLHGSLVFQPDVGLRWTKRSGCLVRCRRGRNPGSRGRAGVDLIDLAELTLLLRTDTAQIHKDEVTIRRLDDPPVAKAAAADTAGSTPHMRRHVIVEQCRRDWASAGLSGRRRRCDLLGAIDDGLGAW